MKLKNIKREIERSSGNIHHYPPLESGLCVVPPHFCILELAWLAC